MSFSAEWLAAREPHDRRARNAEVADALAAHFADRPAIAVVDLACGTGASLRALSAHLPPRQSWRLVDNDLSLLARAQASADPARVTVATVPVDLVRDLEAALDGALDLVTTSAFLDLVSADWLERLVIEAAARTLPVYAALTYDGRIVLDPVDPADARMIAALNRHQRTDKGFGPALGPAAAGAAAAAFERVGYTVVQGRSDWIIGAADGTFQATVLAGMAMAARELGDPSSGDVEAWLTRRCRGISEARSSLRVGHLDLFACPMGRR
jgi:SAM-dependent methyltransferase